MMFLSATPSLLSIRQLCCRKYPVQQFCRSGNVRGADASEFTSSYRSLRAPLSSRKHGDGSIHCIRSFAVPVGSLVLLGLGTNRASAVCCCCSLL